MKMRTLYGRAQNHHRILREEGEDGKGQMDLVVSLMQIVPSIAVIF